MSCLVIGYLIFRSGYLPKALGVLMQIAGFSYLTNSFALILAPAFANRLFPAILLTPFLGEASLCLWLLIKAVNVAKWQEQVSLERLAERNPGHGAVGIESRGDMMCHIVLPETRTMLQAFE